MLGYDAGSGNKLTQANVQVRFGVVAVMHYLSNNHILYLPRRHPACCTEHLYIKKRKQKY